MSRTAIQVEGLTKQYRLIHRAGGATRATEAITHRLRHPLDRNSVEQFEALREVSFEVPQGSALGIVGRNGAGKSTLLKVLTRVTAPTAGRIVLHGRVGSLLEVGTGFHPELTGRENVFLNGALLGMRRQEIRRRFDEIVAFAGVEQFLDTPVKRFSSGMYVRLAFAVAAHLESEILIIDEVLAVGDAEFQAKSIEKMRTAARDGRTVLFVSHQLQTVTALCDRAIYLDHGRLVTEGTVPEVLAAYRRSFDRVRDEHLDARRRPGTGELRFTGAQLLKDQVESGDGLELDFSVGQNLEVLGSYFVSAHVNDANGMTLLQCDSRVVGEWFSPDTERTGRLTIRTPWLKPGRYRIDLFLCQNGIFDAWEGAASFEVMPMLPYPHATSEDGTQNGVVFADFDYTGL